MSMTEIYQPVIVKELLRNDGSCTKEQLARKLADYDLSVVEYYKKVLMRWPKDTLTKHGIVHYDRQSQSFELTSMPTDQLGRDEAVRICDQKIAEWLDRKNKKEKAPEANASVRYEVLKRAKGKCQLSGIPASLRPIDVDHIVPRSKADKNGRVRKDGRLIDLNAME
jgi:5-methylcytosine-specific restriction endonuclease McrA